MGAMYVLVRNAAFAAAMLAAAASQSAQAFPTDLVRIVVPFPAGGAVDTQARIISVPLAERWKQQVIVDPRPGGVTLLGTASVAKSAADGHTVLFTSIQYAYAPALFAKLPYDPLSDLVPITTVTLSPETIVANPSLPAKDIKELIAYAKANPGKLNIGTPGNELTAAYFNMRANVNVVSVPFKGGPPMLTALMAGDIQLGIGAVNLVQGAVKSGRIKLLGVASSKPSPTFPDAALIPKEAPEFEIITWFGLFAPKGTPGEVVRRIRDDVAAVLQVPGIRDRLLQMGGEPGGESPEEFATRVRTDIERWQAVAKAVGFKPQ